MSVLTIFIAVAEVPCTAAHTPAALLLEACASRIFYYAHAVLDGSVSERYRSPCTCAVRRLSGQIVSAFVTFLSAVIYTHVCTQISLSLCDAIVAIFVAQRCFHAKSGFQVSANPQSCVRSSYPYATQAPDI